MDIRWLLQMPQQNTEPVKSPAAALALRAGDQLTASVLEVTGGKDALLAFGRFKAYARLPLPVVTGQDVTIRVVATGSQPRLVMVPDQRRSPPPPGDRLAIRLFEPVGDKPFLSTHARSLKPGETLQGRITGFEKEGLKLVDFGPFKAFAKIDVPVRQGQVVPLTVLQSGNAVTLAMVQPAPAPPATYTSPPAGTVHPAAAGSAGSSGEPPPTAADLGVLRDQIRQLQAALRQPVQTGTRPFSTPMIDALSNLQQALNPASPTDDMGSLVARVRDFVDNSGLYFEKRLEQTILAFGDRSQPAATADLSVQPAIRDLMVKDLKPNLLILKQFIDTQAVALKTADQHMLEAMKSVVQRTLSHIEQQQVMATEKPVDPDLFQAFSHLMFLTDDQRNARLKVYYAKKGRDDDHKDPRVSLLLEMDRMGTVRTDLWKVGKDLNITFFVQEAEIKALIEAEYHRIGKMLDSLFNTVAISVVVNRKKIEAFDGEDLSAGQHHQLDLSV